MTDMLNPAEALALLPQATRILKTTDANTKASNSRTIAAAWRNGSLIDLGHSQAPDRPGRPAAPVLLGPRCVPRRRINKGPTGRIALLHALAHIELNAVDLAWDILVRFTETKNLPSEFINDWVSIADDEAKHFALLNDRLKELGSYYGALPAHDGLWEAAIITANDFNARLAIVPLVLEARGLDVTPPMIEKLERADDHVSAEILRIIHRDEITHVAIGHKWFKWACRKSKSDPVATFKMLVRQYYKGTLKAPFNRESRDMAGFPAEFYEPLSTE